MTCSRCRKPMDDRINDWIAVVDGNGRPTGVILCPDCSTSVEQRLADHKRS